MVFHNLIIKLIKLLQKKQIKNYSWHLQDTIVEVKDIVPNQHLDIELEYDLKNKTFSCIRDYHGTAIYVKSELLERFKNIQSVYNKELNMINLSKLREHHVSGNCFAQVANKTVPYSVSIKEIRHCRVHNIDVYMMRIINLYQTDDLFKDLINYQNIKDKHGLL